MINIRMVHVALMVATRYRTVILLLACNIITGNKSEKCLFFSMTAIETTTSIFLICIFAYVGVVLRISLSQAFILLYSHTHLDPDILESEDVGVFHQAIFANIAGCFFMGILVQFKPTLFFQRNFRLFVGLGTGGLGSLTTFGSWNEEVSIKFYQQGKVFNGIFSLFFGFLSSYGAYFAGRDLGHAILYLHKRRAKKKIAFKAVPNSNNNINENNSDIHQEPKETLDIESIEEESQSPHPTEKEVWNLRIFAIVTWIASTIILIGLAVTGIDHKYTVACLVGSTGAVLRFYMVQRNSTVPNNKLNFPLFTFLVNIIGSLLASLVILFTTPEDVILRYALSIGFSGCLTTVSTFVDELARLEVWQAWIYGTLSLFGTQILLTVVNIAYVVRN